MIKNDMDITFSIYMGKKVNAKQNLDIVVFNCRGCSSHLLLLGKSMDAHSLRTQVIGFKKEVYKQVIDEFIPFIDGN